jgi:hypothetical protein
MRKYIIFICVLFVSFAMVFSATGQSKTPYVGKAKLTIFKINPDGSRSQESEFVILEARDEQGNRLSWQTGGRVDQSSLWLRSAGKLYSVDHNQQVIMVAAELSKPPGVIDASAVLSGPAAPKQDAIRNIPCLRLPRLGKVNGVMTEIGWVCISQEYDGLTLHKESPYELNGTSYIAVQDLIDLKLNEVPPSSWFELPGGYRQVTRTTKRDLKP